MENKEEFMELKEKLRNQYFDEIIKVMIEQDAETNEELEMLGKIYQIPIRIYNSGTIINNKLNELERQFENAQISLYVGCYKDKKGEITSSELGITIMKTLLLEAIIAKKEIVKMFKQAVNYEKYKKAYKVIKVGKRIFNKKQYLKELEYNENINKKFFKDRVEKYENIQNGIINYSLENNLKDSCISHMNIYQIVDKKLFVKNMYESDLKALGLEKITNSLYQELEEKDKNNIELKERESSEETR